MQTGCETAFTTLYLHYSPSIYTAVLKIVKDETCAEEITQDLFTRIWTRRSSLQVESNFSGYLFRAAQHLVIDHFRKVKKDRRLLDNFKQLAGENIEEAEECYQIAPDNHHLQHAIDRLPPQQKKVFQLVRVEGCTYKKAAAILGISPHTVKEYVTLTTRSVKTYLLQKASTRTLLFILSWNYFF